MRIWVKAKSLLSPDGLDQDSKLNLSHVFYRTVLMLKGRYNRNEKTFDS